MICKKFIACAAAFVALVGAYGLSLAAEDSPKPPQSPIRIETVDLQEGEGPAKLKLEGTAGPGTMLYIYVDDAPFVRIEADKEGKWSVEGPLELEGERHMVRVEQYDPETRMLAGRAMVTIARKPSAEP